MRRFLLLLILIVVFSNSFGQKKKGTYYKCMPFNTSSVIPITENGFLKMKVDNKYVFEKRISNLKIIVELNKILNRILNTTIPFRANPLKRESKERIL